VVRLQYYDRLSMINICHLIYTFEITYHPRSITFLVSFVFIRVYIYKLCRCILLTLIGLSIHTFTRILIEGRERKSKKREKGENRL